MRKMSWFAALAGLLFLGVAPVVAGCGDDDDTAGDGDADADADTDADTDADGDGDADCASGDPLANGGCDWTCNTAAAPDFRLTFIDLTAPQALTNPVIGGIVAAAIDEGTFAWLVDNDGGTDFRTGSGTCGDVADGLSDCAFEGGDYPPATGTMDYDSSSGEFRIPTGTGTIDVDVVIHSETAGDIVLKLKQASITGTTSHSSNCVGSRLNDIDPSNWEPGGHVSGKMTVEDAKTVRITAGIPPQSLCDFLSGGLEDGYCDDNPDPATWDNPPDSDVDGGPAWTLEGDIAAIGVNIAQ